MNVEAGVLFLVEEGGREMGEVAGGVILTSSSTSRKWKLSSAELA